ncbi:hypothetical protein, partial [Acidithrix ferrooxidans]|uniref:hypothetical protein n=1 Tax=Acidithrix ferrooxidans TaxID=1280514 RepID=UPI001F43434E
LTIGTASSAFDVLWFRPPRGQSQMRPYSQVSSIYVDSSITLLGSFAMWTAFPSSDYYDPSVPFE